MTVTLPEQLTANSVYRGPLDNDPLTDDELAILLAIPRWAEKAPNATIFRLPLGPEPTHGWVDITFRKARTIIARLATDWRTRLSSGTDALNVNVGPGTTICLLVEPISHALFHWLAFWALGCSIQIISLSMDDDTIALYLNKSECRVAIYSDISSDRMNRIGSGCNAAMIQLPTEEYAHRLAFGYRCGQGKQPQL
jgi:acyl-coenzyme A synthetase/AMP-(fatty) acid ligase